MEAHEKSFAFMNGAIRIEIPFFQRGHMTICFTRKMSLHFMMKGISGMKPKFILNSMYKEGDEEHYGAMLMGMESDAHGVMNQMGHTHDIHATPEKASSFGGQRQSEVDLKIYKMIKEEK